MTKNFQDPNQNMHPQDRKNLLIFFAMTIVVFLLYDTFIHKPQMEARRAAAQQQALLNQQLGPDGALNGADAAMGAVMDRAQAVALSAQRVAVENDHVVGSINLVGGRLDDVSLKDYFVEQNGDENVHLLSPLRSPHPEFSETGWVGAPGSTALLPDASTVWRVRSGASLGVDSNVVIEWNNRQGLVFEREFSMDKDFMITVRDRVINNGRGDAVLYPYASTTQHGIPSRVERAMIVHEGPIAYVGDELHETKYKKLNKKTTQSFEGERGWIGLTQKYWLVAMSPTELNQQDAPDAQMRHRFRFRATEMPDGAYHYKAGYTGSAIVVPAGGQSQYVNQIFVGPKKIGLLKHYQEAGITRFDLAIDYGMLYFLTRPLAKLLIWLGGLTGSFAVALLLLTMLVRLAVFPLANKSYRSFARMRKLAPKMQELKDIHGDDRQGMQQALFKLYQKEKVNPVAGCFPMLLQIPIFFAMYKVLYGTIEMRHTPFWGWIGDMSAPDPTTLFNLFGLLPFDPPSFLMIGAWPCIMCVTLILLQRLSPPPTDATQKTVLRIMPFFITVILASFPAGLVIYWTWSNMLSILQQSILMKQEGVDIQLFRLFSKADKAEDPDVALDGDYERVEEDDGDQTISKPKRKKKK